jgi:CRP/FNR family transcriptional regulator
MNPSENLKNTPLFRDMTADEFRIIAGIITEKSVSQGGALFVENRPAESLYIIADGEVKLTRMISEGEERTLAVIGSGDFIGEMALLHDGERLATCRAIRDTRLYSIKSADFQNLLEREPRACMKLIRSIIDVFNRRLHDADDRVKELLLSSGGGKKRR